MIARVAAVVLIATLLLPSLLAQPRTVTFTKELEYMLTDLFEVTVTAPTKAVEGEEFEVVMSIRALTPLRKASIYVYLVRGVEPEMVEHLGRNYWLTEERITIVDEANLTAGWETTVRRRVKASSWGDLVVEVWFYGYYPSWWEGWKYISIEWHFPMLKVEPVEKANYAQLEENYSKLVWDYLQLNETHHRLMEWSSSLYRNYTSLSRDYESLQSEHQLLSSELSTYRALTPALAATLVAGVPLAYLLGRRHGRAKARPPQATGA